MHEFVGDLVTLSSRDAQYVKSKNKLVCFSIKR